ncbi:C-type mannose receptor 2-like [Mercenaria mercenaria]|uniref:C-type mannose receptor 2-like n=1 Tax=Mercenaria mercenaria TaxID=6596 RepID=UPI00234F024D|nr:C-type mannose receptor 2-like [Mercenaria mercenaria]XP_053379885.1 C-type mannose receptor 2-like [Mercenaria mercenaria]
METFVVILVLAVSICAANIGNCPVHLPRNHHLYEFDTSCYQFNLGFVDWSDALVKCQAKKGKLIKIHSKALQDFIYSTWKGIMHTSSQSKIWIALNYLSSGMWAWYPGREEADYQNWASGLPDNEGEKYCAAVTLTGEWKNYDCDDDSIGYICEFPLTQNQDCPSNLARTYDLLSWRDHCYLLALDSRRDWTTASHSCQHLGGYLVDIHSQEEQDFISNSYRKIRKDTAAVGIGAWIGLSDGQNYYEEGRWNWISNVKELDYQNWSPGQPNNLSDLEDCALMRWSAEQYANGKWHDYPCAEGHDWICKFRKSV